MKPIAFAAAFFFATHLAAFASENVIYGGAGTAKDVKSSTTTDKTPFAIGYLRLNQGTDAVWGLDFAQEGSMLDSTYRQNRAVKQATSYNLLLGRNIIRSEGSRLDFAILIGARERTSDCPNSFLGYACYANEDPDISYSGNFGALLTWSFSKVTIGVRATGESTQALLGVRF